MIKNKLIEVSFDKKKGLAFFVNKNRFICQVIEDRFILI
jgi:hypothetical protein